MAGREKNSPAGIGLRKLYFQASELIVKAKL
jgi:hypothetical protein